MTAAQLWKLVATGRALGRTGVVAPDLARLLEVIAWTGVRRGEALALKWSDLIEGEMHIVRSAARGELKTTKTDDPRVVGVAPELLSALEAQREWLHQVRHPGLGSGLMFPTDYGHAMRRARRTGADVSWVRAESCLKGPLKLIVEKAGLPIVTLHSLRRSYENLLRQAGVDDQVRRTIAGWRSSETQAIYAGVDPSERRAAAVAVVNLVMSSERPRSQSSVA